MSKHASLVVALGASAMVLAALGGCARSYTSAAAPPTPATTQTVINYPDGRWELQGVGTPDSPHYWAWIPVGTNPPTPPSPPSLPILALQRTVKYPTGQWELHGQGTNSAPYYWVWVQAGAPAASVRPVSAPPPPSTTDRVVSSADGRWQLYGSGTNSSPYYWVWTPAGTTPPAPPPPPVSR